MTVDVGSGQPLDLSNVSRHLASTSGGRPKHCSPCESMTGGLYKDNTLGTGRTSEILAQ